MQKPESLGSDSGFFIALRPDKKTAVGGFARYEIGANFSFNQRAKRDKPISVLCITRGRENTCKCPQDNVEAHWPALAGA